MTRIEKYITFSLALVLILSVSVANMSTLYYSIIIVVFLFVFFKYINKYIFMININTFIFIIVAFFSIIFNDINSVFKPFEKFLMFVVIVSVFGPLFNTPKMILFRYNLQNYIKILILIFVSLSFVLLIIGYEMINNLRFHGLASHSMLMGPLASLAALISIDSYKKAQSKSQIILFISLFFISIVSVILTASGSAIISLLFSLILYSLFRSKNIVSTIKYLSIVLFLIILIVEVNPKGILNNLYDKIEKREAIDNITSGRDLMWEDRIKDFKLSPLIGVGFANYVNITYSKVDMISGEDEPGSGWLYLLSSLGLIGTVFYIIPIVSIFSKINRESPITYYFLIFFCIHSIVEGYLLSTGSILGILMWMSIATSLDYHRNKRLKLFN